MDESTWLTGLILFLTHVLGVFHIIHVLLNVRSSQGAIAWMLALIVIPWAAIPFYWVAGRTHFAGYVRARRSDEGELRDQADEMRQMLQEHSIPPNDAFGSAAEYLGGLPFTKGNKLDLLINGEATFKAMFKAISSAEQYLLINFYIVKDDKIGHRFQEALIERARAGVKVCLIYDGFGSHSLPRRYVRKLEKEGIQCHAFGTNKKWLSRLQINFRNHRKIVVIDGKVAFLGGINVGDEYLGQDPKYGNWRDTHVRITGPAVQAIQLVFLEDWNWAANEILDLNWSCTTHEANQECAIIPTGPSDFADSWQLIVAEAANSACERLWITSPYFVPDGGVLTALKTASLRGVDVRILIPEKPDHLTVWLAAFTYQEETLPFGIKLFRYTEGFLHQKTMLIDNRLACVGTANLDNRSFRLNFEISAFTSSPSFIQGVEEMLEKDFSNSRKIKHNELEDRSFLFKIASRAARLMAPIL